MNPIKNTIKSIPLLRDSDVKAFFRSEGSAYTLAVSNYVTGGFLFYKGQL